MAKIHALHIVNIWNKKSLPLNYCHAFRSGQWMAPSTASSMCTILLAIMFSAQSLHFPSKRLWVCDFLFKLSSLSHFSILFLLTDRYGTYILCSEKGKNLKEEKICYLCTYWHTYIQSHWVLYLMLSGSAILDWLMYIILICTFKRIICT